MAIPSEKSTPETEGENLQKLVQLTGLPADYFSWFFYNYGGSATTALTGDTPEAIKNYFQKQYKANSAKYQEWLKQRALKGTTPGERAEAYVRGGVEEQSRLATKLMDVPAGIDPWGRLYQMITEGTKVTTEDERKAQAGAGGGLVSSVADVFSALTPEQLGDLGVGEISEKFGLQRLAIEEPEAFLQAMFDKSGITPSPPVYGFLRDLMPSIVLLASTREGQDIINSPGGAVQLNKAINEVISQGYPSKGSILEGLAGMGGLGRAFLGEGQFEAPRQEFRFVAATLNDLLGPTMSQPLRQALFNTKAIETQGDRFLSAAARGMYKGSFVDWLKDQGYPLPDLPAYTPTAGAKFVEEVGGVTGVSSTGAPTFQVKGGIYEGE